MNTTRLLLLTITLSIPLHATPITSHDGVSIKGDSGIGLHLSGPGDYLFGLEDLPCEMWCDYDFNDLLGIVKVFEEGFIQFQVVTGIGDYYKRGLVSFMGTQFDSLGRLQLVFSTPSGIMLSGTPQVWIQKVSTPSQVPEPSPWATLFVGLLLILGVRWLTRTPPCA